MASGAAVERVTEGIALAGRASYATNKRQEVELTTATKKSVAWGRAVLKREEAQLYSDG